MDKTLFAELVESMTQMGEIARGQRNPSRMFDVSDADVKRIREASGLSQARFADVIRVDVGTLRNWEQGRRQPTGPARVLLEVLRVNPVAVLEAVNAKDAAIDPPPRRSKRAAGIGAPGPVKRAAAKPARARRSA